MVTCRREGLGGRYHWSINRIEKIGANREDQTIMTEKEGLSLRLSIISLLNDINYMSDVRKACRGILQDLSGDFLEDSIQDGIKRALAFADKTSTPQGITNIRPWLFGIFQNSSRDYLRKFLKTRHLHADISELENTIVQKPAYIDSKIDIKNSYHRAMALISDSETNRRRRKILSYIVQGMRTGEIAKVLQIPHATVSKDIVNLRIQIECIERVYQKLLKSLSNRQRDILECAVDGKRGSDIAKLLGISDSG